MAKALSKVAIVGGGLSGLSCAYALRHSGVDVTVMDMGARGPGGRASTRRQSGLQFDHGLAFLASPSSAKVGAVVHELQRAGALVPWDVRLGVLDASSGALHCHNEQPGRRPWAQPMGEASAGCAHRLFKLCGVLRPGALPLLVGASANDDVARHLLTSSGATYHQSRVTDLEWDEARRVWTVRGEAVPSQAPAPIELGEFDAVVVTNSAAFRPDSPAHVRMRCAGACLCASAEWCTVEADLFAIAKVDDVCARMRSIRQDATFALMMAFPRSLQSPFSAYVLHGHPSLMWLACDSSKPGRTREDGQECWVALACPAHARQLLADKPLTVDGKYNPQSAEYLESLRPGMLQAAMAAFGALGITHVPETSFCALQRWGAAFVTNPLGEPCAAVPEARFVACGDFCLGSTAELAMSSGLAAADVVLSWSSEAK